jgi:UDP-GlcNAc:undecaprenyl-phosphate/decaprenyl-phosphate GlcNAc-1-phosphate transferase
MIWLCLALVPIALAVSLPVTAVMIRVGHRLSTLDSPGVEGQVKAPLRRVPNTGGVGIFAGLVVPIVVGLIAAHAAPETLVRDWLPSLLPHLAGIKGQTGTAAIFLGCLTGLHVLGLIDDRRALGVGPKMVAMVVAAAVVVWATGSRLLTLADVHAGGPWLSMVLTVAWIVVVTNALNFMDNMDGLAAGVTAVAGSCFLAATLIGGQWFVAAVLALLVGSCAGFLAFNRPPARVFMGDAGSLVLGFTLAFLTVRTTYVSTAGAAAPASGAWYGVFMPLVVLAVPLYDFVSVTAIRLSQGRSPFVGDLQHLSHRLVNLGLSKRGAVVIIWGLTAVTGMAGVMLGSLEPWQALIAAGQVVMLLVVIALFEYGRSGRRVGP